MNLDKFKWLDTPAQYDETTGTRTPSKQGALSLMSNVGTGMLAPFLQAYGVDNGYSDLLKRQMQERAADQEFEMFLLKQKQKEMEGAQLDPVTAAILAKDYPEILASMYGQSPTAPAGMPMNPMARPSLAGEDVADQFAQFARGRGDAGFVPQSIDLGNTTLKNVGFSGQESVAKKQTEAEYEAAKQLDPTDRFIRRFSEAQKEADTAFPSRGKATVKGAMQRVGVNVAQSVGVLPKTKAFSARLKTAANEMARSVEGGRVTDQDRAVYANAMANVIENPDDTNVILVSDSLLDLKNKGGDITPMLEKMSSSDVPILQKIAKEVGRFGDEHNAQVEQYMQKYPGRSRQDIIKAMNKKGLLNAKTK